MMEGASAGLQTPWCCLQSLGTSAMPWTDDCLPLPGRWATGNGPGSLTGNSGKMENVPGSWNERLITGMCSVVWTVSAGEHARLLQGRDFTCLL